MATTILIKNSTSAGAVPSATNIEPAELAVNLVDKKLYTKNGSTVIELGTAPSSITSAGTVQFGIGNNDGLSDGSTTIKGFVNEADMASNSNVKLPTQQSVKTYVDTSIANLVGTAPTILDTLGEISASLRNDADNGYAVLASKLSLAGGTMSGAIAMGGEKITGLDNPINNQDAVTKAYVTTTSLPLTGGTLSGALAMSGTKITGLGNPDSAQDAVTKAYVTSTSLPFAGGTMSGNIVLGSNRVTSTENPTDDTHLARKKYVDDILGSATGAAAALTDFDSVYQRALPNSPNNDEDRNENALTAGALYFDTGDDAMYVYDGTSWGLVAPIATALQVEAVLAARSTQNYGLISATTTTTTNYGGIA